MTLHIGAIKPVGQKRKVRFGGFESLPGVIQKSKWLNFNEKLPFPSPTFDHVRSQGNSNSK